MRKSWGSKSATERWFSLMVGFVTAAALLMVVAFVAGYFDEVADAFRGLAVVGVILAVPVVLGWLISRSKSRPSRGESASEPTKADDDSRVSH